MSAAVYKSDGYWNGSVWMPHQWFVWRYLLDIGEVGFALAIARRALELWEREVRESWCCFEHFPIATQRGPGWHHFGGLSAPILNWHAALHSPGRLSGGYNTWVLSHQQDETGFTTELVLDGRPGDQHPELESAARKLLTFSKKHLEHAPLPTWRLRASVRVEGVQFFEAEVLLSKWLLEVTRTLVEQSVFYLGQTPKAHLQIRRLSEAKNLLLAGDLLVKEVAFHVGFSSQSAFNHWFTHSAGCNPKTFVQKAAETTTTI
jgi:hypothetical protein